MIYADNTGTASDYALLTDDDGTFATGATATAATSISGDTITFTNVTIDDEDYFTLAGPFTPYPGGIGLGLDLWLKADAGTTGSSPVTSWSDQSENANDATAGGDPQLLSSGLNYNNTIVLDGTDDYFTGNLNIPSNNNTTFAVAKMDTTSVNWTGMVSYLSTGETRDYDNVSSFAHLIKGGASKDIRAQGNNALLSSFLGALDDNAFHVFTSKMDATNQTTYRDGEGAGAVGHTCNISAEEYYLGSRYTNGAPSFFMAGEFAEVITYNQTLSATDQNKVESYLAIKYGITLSNAGGGTAGDYTASDGTTIWDASANPTYHNDVTGIGLDNDSDLDQQKSMSSNSDGMVIIDKGGALGTNMDFILWGNNNEDVFINNIDNHPSYP